MVPQRTCARRAARLRGSLSRTILTGGDDGERPPVSSRGVEPRRRGRIPRFARFRPSDRQGALARETGARSLRPRYWPPVAVSTARRAALGFSSHVGWAAVVAVAGPLDSPGVVAKRRVELAATFDVGAVYHVGQGLPLEEAEAFVRSSEQTFHAAASAGIAALAAELRGLGLEPIASAVLAGGAKPLPPLEAILRSHALVHAAEGELYRRVLARASASCSIPATLVPAKDLPARAARAAGLPERRLAAKLAEIGKASGKPWARDQKDAALAAWIALAEAS